MSYETPLQMRTPNSFLPYPNQYIPDHVLKKAKSELGETPEIQMKALEELKNMLQECPKTKDIDFEEDFLIHYLRASKYKTEKPFKQLQNYVDFRTKNNSTFGGVPDEFFSTKCSVRTFNILPERCPDGCIVYYAQVGKWNPDELSFEVMKKLFIIVSVQAFRDPMVQINGVKIIYDMEGTEINHMRQATLKNLYFLYHMPLNCCPSRIKEIHFVNPTLVLNVSWKIASPFFSKKFRSRCHFHSEPSKLLEFFPSSMLPAKCGGDLSNIDSTELMRRLNIEQKNHPIGGQRNFY